jgi:16S rRNA (guanine(966)-N(2))-methyltransferase RsmD
LRIISGIAKGKRLTGFSGLEIRPTSDRVREALFSILNSRYGNLEGKRVLDLYAGTGAMAIEALSRGAALATLVDQGEQSAKIIPSNLKTSGLASRATLIRSGVLKALPALSPCDLIFLDPPYGKGLVPQTIEALSEFDLLGAEGMICAEAAQDDPVPETIGRFRRIEERRYGSTVLHLFTHCEAV